MGCKYYIGDREFSEEDFKRYLAEGGMEELGVDLTKLKPSMGEEPVMEAEAEYDDASDPFSNLPKEEAPGKGVFNAPALVELMRKLTGDVPKVRAMKDALGRMYRGTKRLLLHPELFKEGNEDMLAKVLAHEIGHLKDILTETIGNSKLGAKLAALSKHYSEFLPFSPTSEGLLTEKERRRLRAEAAKLTGRKTITKEIDEEVEQEIGITAQDVIDIWNTVDAGARTPNLAEFISKLTDAEKVSIVKEAMKGNLSPLIENIKEKIKVQTGNKVKIKEVLNNAEYKKKFAELIEDEIKKRKFWKEEELREELFKFSTEVWRPVSADALANDPSLAKYRGSSNELFADALSAFLTSPGTLMRTAPKFYEALNNYMSNHPEFEKAYTEMLDVLNADEATRARHQVNMLQEGFNKADEIRKASADEKINKRNRKSFLEQFITKNFALINRLKGDWFGDKGKLSFKGKVLSDVEAMQNIKGMQGLVIDRLYGDTRKNLTDEEYNALRTIAVIDRITGARRDIANPDAINPELAEAMKKEVYATLSPESRKKVDETLTTFRDNVFKIMEQAYDMGLFSNETWDTVLSNKDNYVTFTPVTFAYKDVSAGMKAATGTLEKIIDPIEQTTLKMASIMSVAIRNQAVLSMEKGLKQIGTDSNDIIEAKPTRTPDGNVVFQAAPVGKELVRFVRDGKAAGVYVPETVARIFETDRVDQIKFLTDFNSVFRPMVTTLNLGFALWNNPWRDNLRTIPNLVSLVRLSGRGGPVNVTWKYLKNNLSSWSSAFKYAQGTAVAPIIEEMVRNNAVYRGVFGRYETNFVGAERELNALANIDFNKSSDVTSNKVLTTVGSIFKTLELATKIGSYKTLKDYGFDAESAGVYVRKYTGTPDFADKGTVTPIINQWMPFANVMIQGMRSDINLASTKETALPYWSMRTLLAVPSIAMRLAVLGYFGKQWQQAYNAIDDYNSHNFFCITFPGWVDDKGKQTFIRIPLDEMSRMQHAIISNAPGYKYTDVLRVGAGFTPSFSPLLEILGGLGQYAAQGNVYDSFRGKEVFKPDEETLNQDNMVNGLPKLALWVGEKAGFGKVMKIISYDGKTTTEYGFNALEQISGLGSMIKSSDKGLAEKAAKATEDMEVKDAKLRTLLDDVVASVVTNMDVKQYTLEAAEKGAQEVTDKMTQALAESQVPKEYQELFTKIVNTTNLEERTKLFQQVKDNYSEAVYNMFKTNLNDIEEFLIEKQTTINSKVKIGMLYGNTGVLAEFIKGLIPMQAKRRQAALDWYAQEYGADAAAKLVDEIQDNNLMDLGEYEIKKP